MPFPDDAKYFFMYLVAICKSSLCTTWSFFAHILISLPFFYYWFLNVIIYYDHKYSVRYMYYKYVIQSMNYLFILMSRVFNFAEIILSFSFSFYDSSYLRNLCQPQGHKISSYIFFWKIYNFTFYTWVDDPSRIKYCVWREVLDKERLFL